MDLATAEKLILLENDWIEYSKRLVEAEQESLAEFMWMDDAIAVYVDPVYCWDGSRCKGPRR